MMNKRVRLVPPMPRLGCIRTSQCSHASSRRLGRFPSSLRRWPLVGVKHGFSSQPEAKENQNTCTCVNITIQIFLYKSVFKSQCFIDSSPLRIPLRLRQVPNEGFHALARLQSQHQNVRQMSALLQGLKHVYTGVTALRKALCFYMT